MLILTNLYAFPFVLYNYQPQKTCDKGGGSDHKSFKDTIILHGASTGCQTLETQKQWNNILPSGAPSLVSHIHQDGTRTTKMLTDCLGAASWTFREVVKFHTVVRTSRCPEQRHLLWQELFSKRIHFSKSLVFKNLHFYFENRKGVFIKTFKSFNVSSSSDKESV